MGAFIQHFRFRLFLLLLGAAARHVIMASRIKENIRSHALLRNKKTSVQHTEHLSSSSSLVSVVASTPTNGTKLHDLKHFGLKPPITPRNFVEGTRTCGTPEPTRERILHSNRIVEKYIENKKSQQEQGRKVQASTLLVPTCFHVLRPEGDTDDQFLNAEMLQRQLDGLNQGFSSQSCCDSDLWWCDGECSVETNIRFAMATFVGQDVSTTSLVESTTTAGACITRTQNDDWYYSSPIDDVELDNDMRLNLRKGDATVVNIYFKQAGGTLLGIAQFPSSYAAQAYTDGVVVSEEYVIGGGDFRFGEGDTLTHELGKMLLLFATVFAQTLFVISHPSYHSSLIRALDGLVSYVSRRMRRR